MTSMSHLTQYQMETLMSHQHLIRSRRKISMSHHHLTISQEEASLSYHHLTWSQRNTNESSPFHKNPKRDISKSSSSHEISDGGYWSKCHWLSSMIEIQIRSWSSPHIVYMILYHFFIKVRELTDFGAMHLITSLLNSLISQTLLFMVMLTSAENTPPVIVIKHLPVKN